jgi:hypothetical protein
MTARRYGIAVAGALFVFALPAFGWVFEIPFGARVNGHQFDKIRVEGKECELALKLSFDAPPKQYDSGAKNRNYHRFRARVSLKNGKSVVTPVFFNDAPGRRAYRYRHDTAADGCWAKEKTTVVKVDVEGCRARGCKVEEFKD